MSSKFVEIVEQIEVGLVYDTIWLRNVTLHGLSQAQLRKEGWPIPSPAEEGRMAYPKSSRGRKEEGGT